MRKEKNAKRRKTESILSLLLLLLMGIITVSANQLYLDPEKAFRNAAALEGLDHQGEIFLMQEKENGRKIYIVSELKYQLEDSYLELINVGVSQNQRHLLMAELERIGGIFWKCDSIWAEFYTTQLQAWYQQGVETIVGSCQNPDIKEVTMKWGHWIEGENGWETYVMDEGAYTIDEKGFFYQEVDTSKALPNEHGNIRLVQVVYIEGKDKEGNILYRDGIDEDGRKFTFNEEVK